MQLSAAFRATFFIVLSLGLSTRQHPPAALAAPASAAGTERPLLEITQSAKYGGLVEAGTVVTYQFTVRNRGNADLEITRVVSSCGCSVAKWDRIIRPGAVSVIQAQMHTEPFVGLVSKHLTVISNDPDRPEVELTISARVEPLVWIRPGPVATVSVEDRPVTREFILERNRGRPMKVLDVTTTAPYVKAEAMPLSGVGRFRVKVTATSDAPFGRNTLPIVVRTDLAEANTISLQLTVERGIVAEPPMLFYGLLPIDLGKPIQATVTLARHSRPFHIKNLSVEDRQLAPQLETIQDGTEYRVTVSYAGGWDAGLKRTALEVTTDDPLQPILQIPIQALVRPKSLQRPPVPLH